ncbi:MAG: VCBS repeat-containing protein [Deltaproteobacteria bacterium]|nr:VCBS repeat-containing protein [Deltaproteobacteria bacterium]
MSRLLCLWCVACLAACGGGSASPPAIDVAGDVVDGDQGDEPDPGHADDHDEPGDESSSDGDIITSDRGDSSDAGRPDAEDPDGDGEGDNPRDPIGEVEDVPPDASGFGLPCAVPRNCPSGFCVETPGGRVCSVACAAGAGTGCPEGFSCDAGDAEEAADGRAVGGACVQPDARLCAPCKASQDCVAVPGTGTALGCVGLGAAGAFCLRACDGQGGCPSGFACAGGACAPVAGECACSPLAVQLGAATGCEAANVHGTCPGERRCEAGGLGACSAPEPAPDACNGFDDDCDGATDEDLGELVCGTGACARSGPACAGGAPGACEPGLPAPETCNGIDDDCDGGTDEDLGEAACGAGACSRSGPACAGGVPWECEPGPPGVETCNGVDDDCDGATDEELGAVICGTGRCVRLVAACAGGAPQECVPGPPADEVCNFEDDDCDGATDEDLGELTCGTGACARSLPACVFGVGRTCEPGLPADEVCNRIDDDCDGETDEGFCRTEDDVCVPAGAPHPANPCRSCQPGAQPGPYWPADWGREGNGKVCGPERVCLNGYCKCSYRMGFPSWPAVDTGPLNGVLSEDLNGDGFADLVVVARDPTRIRLLRHHGNATFLDVGTFPMGGVCGVRFGDLDGDGLKEVIVADPSKGIAVLRSKGGPFEQLIPIAGTGLCALAVADLDGNGLPEIVVSAVLKTTHRLRIYPNLGALSFGSPQTCAEDLDSADSAIAADIDGDGDVDIVTDGWWLETRLVYRNDGTGKFGTPAKMTSVGPQGHLAASDVDGDGDPDLLFLRGSPYSHCPDDSLWDGFCTRFNDGTGVFGPDVCVQIHGGTWGDVAPADLDGDGDPDAVGGSLCGQVRVFRNEGGVFQEASRVVVAESGASPVLADLDGDGDADLVSAADEAVVFVLNEGNLTFAGARTSAGVDASRIVAADLDQDGDTDIASLVWRTPVMRLGVLLNAGDGTLAGEPGLALPGMLGDLAAADMDGNGTTDLVYGGGILRNAGDATFDWDGTAFLPDTWSAYRIAVGDLDGFGGPDVAVTTMDAVHVFLMPGDGTIGDRIEIPIPNAAVAIGRTNKDGIPRLLVGAGKQVRVLMLDEAGSFVETTAFEVNASPEDGDIRWVHTFDYDHDGLLDIAATTNGAVFLYEGHSSVFTFGKKWTPPGSFGLRTLGLVAADLNGGGGPDLVTASPSAGTVVVRQHDGWGFGGEDFQYPAGWIDWFAGNLVAADFDGDGQADIAVTAYRPDDYGADVNVLLSRCLP